MQAVAPDHAVVAAVPVADHVEDQDEGPHKAPSAEVLRPVVVVLRNVHVAKSSSNRHQSSVASKFPRVMATLLFVCAVALRSLILQNVSRQIQQHWLRSCSTLVRWQQPTSPLMKTPSRSWAKKLVTKLKSSPQKKKT